MQAELVGSEQNLKTARQDLAGSQLAHEEEARKGALALQKVQAELVEEARKGALALQKVHDELVGSEENLKTSRQDLAGSQLAHKEEARKGALAL